MATADFEKHFLPATEAAAIAASNVIRKDHGKADEDVSV